MRFELFIALRYLLARRKQAFISVISLISTVGVAVGVIALIVALQLPQRYDLRGRLARAARGSAHRRDSSPLQARTALEGVTV